MARLAILGNGKLTVGLNEHGLVHDFYYPYVGQDNLTTARSTHHKIGLWIDGVFEWIDSQSWQINVELSSDSLTSRTKFVNDNQNIEIFSEDFVHHDLDFFGRKIKIFNKSDSPKNIRLFMHQVFEISRDGRADTALYVPEGDYILDYKGKTSLAIGGVSGPDNKLFDQYAVGNYAVEGKTGTFSDAEDGQLSGNPVEHGGVDSVIGFEITIEPQSYDEINYWVIADDNQQQAAELNQKLKTDFDELMNSHKHLWGDWLYRSGQQLKGLDNNQKQLLRKSLMTIRAHCDKRGGIIASCDSSIYNYGRDYYSYVWPRDGAFVMWPFIRLGYFEEPRAFFNFCADVMNPAGYMMHKYQPDRAVGSTWHPLVHDRHSELAIQEDETAIIIFMLEQFYQYSNDKIFTSDIFQRYVIKAANFLGTFFDSTTDLPHASYDLWEEKFLTSTYTTAIVYRGLKSAVHLAEQFDYTEHIDSWQSAIDKLEKHFTTFINTNNDTLIKGFIYNPDNSTNDVDNILDISSLYGVLKFGYIDKNYQSTINNTAIKIEQSLLNNNQSGGSPRYENDNYFRISPNSPPNPWIVTTLWMAQYYMYVDDYQSANKLIKWCENLTLGSGIMSEQINPYDSSAMSVTPLVWSHAEYINTVLDFYNKK